MNDIYNDLQPNPVNSADIRPPSNLAHEAKLQWLDKKIAAAEAYKGVLTDSYYRESKGHLAQELRSVREQLVLGHFTPSGKSNKGPASGRI